MRIDANYNCISTKGLNKSNKFYVVGATSIFVWFYVHRLHYIKGHIGKSPLK